MPTAPGPYSAFANFRKDVVDLDPEETKKARSSRDFLILQLKYLGVEDPAFPKLTGRFELFGSFARRTKIRPLDDIDIMMVVDGSYTSITGPHVGGYTYFLRIDDRSKAPLAAFPDEYGYVNSTKILNQIKASLSEVVLYKKAGIKKNYQAVVLNLISYPWNFDIVPAVAVNKPWTSDIDYYLIPDGTSNWIRTDPRRDGTKVTKVNQDHNNAFLPAARLLKYWNRRTHKPVLGSYYFETLCLDTFNYATTITSTFEAIEYFFRICPFYLHRACPDPKGLGPNLDADYSSETKDKIGEAMRHAAQHAANAIRYQNEGKPKEALDSWQRIFGPEFPTYG